MNPAAKSHAGSRLDGAKSQSRPDSRASTSSIHSTSTHPIPDPSHGDPSDISFVAQWNAANGAQRTADNHNSQQRDAGNLILQAAGHISRDIPLDTSVATSLSQSASFGQLAASGRHSLPGDYSLNNSFADDSQLADADTQMIDRDANDDVDSVMGVATTKGSRTSANNELEMRQLFQANKHRTLQEVAKELHGNERGPNSERARQIFAMLWINKACSTGRGSVPRGRVYSNYVNQCGSERITVLNPASFGKLVRVLFPGLKTRRLGVRGESKYHYVNFQVEEEQPAADSASQPDAMPAVGAPSQSMSFNTVTGATQSQQQVSTQSGPQQLNAVPVAYPKGSTDFVHSVYNQSEVTNSDQLQSASTKTAQVLQFAQDNDDVSQSEPLILPQIEPFLPEGTDVDASMSLTALYRSHCTSLIECIRFCREKNFFHLFTSFQGTLTVPVQKLFSSPALAPWIEECDFVLYQRMIRIISSLVLQVVPKPVLDTLRNISDKLVMHIRQSFHGQPSHVIQAREAPAAIFASLLDRALRVNATAHAAANMLSNPANRDTMYLDWITMVHIRKAAECLPTRAMDDAVEIMLVEIRDLLKPVNIPWDMEVLTLAGDMAMRSGRQPGEGHPDDGNASNILDRWVAFLRSLPARFPYASATQIMWCVQRLSTTIMRDLTIFQSRSFGSWWVTKCWIDEMIAFLAEQGGFMTQKTTRNTPGQIANLAEKEKSRKRARLSSGSEDFTMPNTSHSQPDRAPFPSGPSSNSHGLHDLTDGNPDDSGIGIRTPEEEFNIEKFSIEAADSQELLSASLVDSL